MNNLPSSLVHLSFGDSFNQEVNNLPLPLKHLAFGSAFNLSVDLLPNLETITLGRDFQRSINLLPETLTKLTMVSYDFNNKLPPLLFTHVNIISNIFDQPIEFLSPRLISLKLPTYYTCKLELLPYLTSLTHLRCVDEVITSFPDSLTSFHCLDPCAKETMDVISNSSLSSLQLDICLQTPLLLPHSLKTLKLSNGFWVEGRVKFPLNDLPASLTRLEFGQDRLPTVGNLPASLTHLICYSSNQPIDSYPPNLTHLSFGAHFNEPIVGKLPHTLHSLEIGRSFSQPLRSLPPSLKLLSSMLSLLCAWREEKRRGREGGRGRGAVFLSRTNSVHEVTRRVVKNSKTTCIEVPPTLATLIVSTFLLYLLHPYLLPLSILFSPSLFSSSLFFIFDMLLGDRICSCRSSWIS